MKERDLHKPFSKRVFLFIVLALFALMIGSLAALANENKVTVMTSTLNVRYGPGLSHEILTQVHEEDSLNILGEENQWYKVRLSNNNIGWVASWLVENEEVSADTRANGRISGNQVNIRQFSSADSPVLGTVNMNEEYQILYTEGDWVQILYGGRVAWIHANYIERLDSTVIAASSEETNGHQIRIGMNPTNIRSSPDANAPLVQTVSSVETYMVIGEENSWYEIELSDGSTAFVASWLTEPVTDENEASAQSSQAAALPATHLSEATIVIDAGHGGHDPGAVAKTGFTEADIALATSLKIAENLRTAGANVIMTRTDDTFVTLNDRVYYAHRAHADAFISIHYDAVDIPNSMSGTTTYYYSENERELADTINHYLIQNGPLRNNGVRHGNYFVLNSNHRPSILLELGYMNHDHDITLINTAHYHQTIADAVYYGLSSYFSP
ncbi:N-acetylmuramoyl-L-alanine amidase [Alkalibacterium sp. AK22]|uniref:N-acetylmuramoyl-L-alanine amidase n=1 Tax=Alkalibacterium sp. AK22 TaxID=1229520 RepID=UPI00044709E1|nr:N-acetylmuramoyl-L-alanine amidase [Alkalibacterium sp. AK22]EXJ22638.1 N-acetylmuramoyl-L-alanine amidase [Alkalibacterium sp. AK22]